MRPESFGEFLRNLRRQLGLSAADVSRKAGLSPSYVSVIESGKAIPKPATIHKLADAFGLTAGERAELERLASIKRPATKAVAVPGVAIWKHLPTEIFGVNNNISDVYITDDVLPDCVRFFSGLLACVALHRGLLTDDRRSAILSLVSPAIDEERDVVDALGGREMSWHRLRRRMVLAWRQALFADVDTTRLIVTELEHWDYQRFGPSGGAQFSAYFRDKTIDRLFGELLVPWRPLTFVYDYFASAWLLSVPALRDRLASFAPSALAALAGADSSDVRFVLCAAHEAVRVDQVNTATRSEIEAALDGLKFLKCLYALPVSFRRELPSRTEFHSLTKRLSDRRDALPSPNKPRPAD